MSLKRPWCFYGAQEVAAARISAICNILNAVETLLRRRSGVTGLNMQHHFLSNYGMLLNYGNPVFSTSEPYIVYLDTFIICNIVNC